MIKSITCLKDTRVVFRSIFLSNSSPFPLFLFLLSSYKQTGQHRRQWVNWTLCWSGWKHWDPKLKEIELLFTNVLI